ncbi:MAG: T9SS type A sorting domain-containing protein [Ignavibacteria bacterium]|nr:T9SS type A sorting domain-containing protein [Ignavibacteria bacterium]
MRGNGTTLSAMNYTYTDRSLNSGVYSYRLKQIDFNGSFEYFNLSNEVNIGVPSTFEMSQNYPNPFNPSTKINYDLPKDGLTVLRIFDISGREVSTPVNEIQTAGYYTVNFNGSNLSSGIYIYTLTSNNQTVTKKMLLVK